MVQLLLVKPTPRNQRRQKNHLSVPCFFIWQIQAAPTRGGRKKKVQEKAQQTPPSSGTQVPGWCCTHNTPTPLPLLIETNKKTTAPFSLPILSLPTGARVCHYWWAKSTKAAVTGDAALSPSRTSLGMRAHATSVGERPLSIYKNIKLFDVYFSLLNQLHPAEEEMQILHRVQQSRENPIPQGLRKQKPPGWRCWDSSALNILKLH